MVVTADAGGIFAARRLAAHFKMPLLNPLLVAMVVIIPFLLLTGIPYEHYFKGSEVLNDLLQPAVVALAYPLYEQLHQIRARWKSIISICFVGSLVAMITGTSVALLMGATPEIAASVLPKSVTTPIAMAVGGSIGGIPAISAVCVIFVGILGAVFGHTLLNAMHIRTKAARGLAMGTASHALGTARCAELDYQEGAFSSLALVICGIITSAGSALFVSAHSGGNALTTGQKTGLKFAIRRAFFI
ncbi:LrgA-associated membrane protein LrgB [Salmonella enterica subsp. enterica]|uniref:LrgA-associated membrane protein LrgB n=2 Tax=Enterobacteriaceae TaxID=543 RepID=A0A379W6G6_SALET|nr:LrgA-associated membrane protein LrgB [Salmonella enterica subsp. enterica]